VLGIVALVFVIILSVKLSIAMNRHRAVMVSNDIAPTKIRMLQVSSLLYVPSVVAFGLPIGWPAWLAPIPFGFLLLVPGIALGRKYSKVMECSGTDVGVDAGRNASNIMWLGLGIVIFIVGNMLVASLIPSADIMQ